MEEHGVVISVLDGRAKVRMEDNAACGSCSQRGGCTPGEGAARTLTARDPLGVQPGQRVTVALPEGGTGKALALAYGIPLVMLFVGAALGYRYAPAHLDRDLISALSALGGLGLAFWLLHRFRDRYEGGASLTPVVIRIDC